MADDLHPRPERSEPQPGIALARSISIPDHELIQSIGKGGCGEVWLAKNSLGAYRAVKIVYETTFRDKKPFEREFNGVKRFEPISRLHEGLTDVLHVGRDEAGGYFYCVMELADDVRSGQNITPGNYLPRTLAYEASQHRLPVTACLQIGLTVASALDFLHQRGLIHRDVKPSNIIFVNGIPKLADIGLVAELADAKSFVGTDGFIPPEGPGSVQADVYSLGKVLYEISTGKDRRDFPELPTRCEQTIHERELVELNNIVVQACCTDPKERYRSARQMVEDLRAVQTGGSAGSSWKKWRTRRTLIPAGVAACVGLAILYFSGHTPFSSKRAIGVTPAEVPQGLVGWWRAEDNGQDSAGTNHGHLFGVGFTRGQVGRAFDMMSQWHRVYIPDSDDFKLTNSLTIEGWVYLRYGEGYIFMRGGKHWGLDPYVLHIFGEKIDFAVDHSRTEFMHLMAPFPRNEWKHLAATLEGTNGEMRIYIDGEIAARTNTTVRPLGDFKSPDEGSIGIGNVGSFSRNSCFNGMIDEIALYSRALSPAEIQRIFRAGSKGKHLSAPRPSAELPAQPENPSTVSRIPAPPGSVGSWPGNGTALDVVGTNHGILHNVSFAPGMVGQAFRFNGSNSFVEIPRGACLDVKTQLTIECWIKADLDNPMNECCQGIVSSDFYDLEVSSTIEPVGINFGISAENGMTTSDANNGGAVISSGEWHHVGATYDGARLQLYIDGQVSGKPLLHSGPIFPMQAKSFVAIGSEDGRTVCPNCVGERYFKGLIDEVSIYDRALTAAEIAAIYHAGSAGKAILENQSLDSKRENSRK